MSYLKSYVCYGVNSSLTNQYHLYITAVRVVLYCVLRSIKCPGTFEIKITFKNEKDHVMHKMIEEIIVISKF